jgi:hypothetical protein
MSDQEDLIVGMSRSLDPQDRETALTALARTPRDQLDLSMIVRALSNWLDAGSSVVRATEGELKPCARGRPESGEPP